VRSEAMRGVAPLAPLWYAIRQCDRRDTSQAFHVALLVVRAVGRVLRGVGTVAPMRAVLGTPANGQRDCSKRRIASSWDSVSMDPGQSFRMVEIALPAEAPVETR